MAILHITLVSYCDGCEQEVSKNEIITCGVILDVNGKIIKKGHIGCIKRWLKPLN